MNKIEIRISQLLYYHFKVGNCQHINMDYNQWLLLRKSKDKRQQELNFVINKIYKLEKPYLEKMMFETKQSNNHNLYNLCTHW